MKKFFALATIVCLWSSLPMHADTLRKNMVFTFSIKEDIAPPAWRLTQKAFEEAINKKADYIILELNTYGGMVDIADSIRTKILNSPIPVYVFINNNAASAGALISLACKKIYMTKSATIGAATVVTQEGKVAPEKYQSYMKSIMRATAESHGKRILVRNNDTIEVWYREPKIAEAMVDSSVHIDSLAPSGKLLSLTALEAIKVGYCEGIVENINELLAKEGIEQAKVEVYQPNWLERIILFLLNPVVQGILIMLIIGGIYFELQTPGIGFPLAVAIFGAIFYFAPLYLEGIAEHWEILLFIIGIALILIELFVTPGFGILGISGIALIITGLVLSMIDNIVFTIDGAALPALLKALGIVITAICLSFFTSLYLSSKLLFHSKFRKLSLQTVQEASEGYVGVQTQIASIVGKIGITTTPLRPSGKIEVEHKWYDAVSEDGFLQANETIEVVRFINNQAYVRKYKS